MDMDSRNQRERHDRNDEARSSKPSGRNPNHESRRHKQRDRRHSSNKYSKRSRTRSRSRSRRHRLRSTSRSRSRSRNRHRRERSRTRSRTRSRSHERRLGSRYCRSRSRSRSNERREKERADRERNKIAMRQLLAKNYEEQMEKMRLAAQQQQLAIQSNPQAISLKEQVERRKQLWTKKETPLDESTSSTGTSTTASMSTCSSANVWKQSTFSNDTDGKVSAKFKRLMGMRSDPGTEKVPIDGSLEIERQREYFTNLEKQYEVARTTTHTQRGVGLGFGSSAKLLQPKPKL